MNLISTLSRCAPPERKQRAKKRFKLYFRLQISNGNVVQVNRNDFLLTCLKQHSHSRRTRSYHAKCTLTFFNIHAYLRHYDPLVLPTLIPSLHWPQILSLVPPVCELFTLLRIHPSNSKKFSAPRLASLSNGDSSKIATNIKNFLPNLAILLLTKKVAALTGDVRCFFEDLRCAVDNRHDSSSSA
jgi:hypothetical protein